MLSKYKTLKYYSKLFFTMNNFPNLQVAFDNYSNDGATYNGQNIQTIPELQELYSRISRTSDIITPEMIENELRSIINQRR